MKTICNGKINNAGICEKCYQTSQTTSAYCTRLIDVQQDKSKPMKTIERQIIEIAESALMKIYDPINWMRNNLKEGESLNGTMAIQVSKDPYWLRQVATDALLELSALKSRYKEAQCHAIIEKVREANTPDKRSFEEAEAESRMSEEQNIIKALSGEKIPEVQTITSTDYKEPDGAEEWFDKNSINYKGVRSRHHAIQMLNDFARQSLKGELINFLRENNWLSLEDEANATKVVDSYLKIYGQAQPSDEVKTVAYNIGLQDYGIPAECRECKHKEPENCNTCDILHPQFR